MSHGIWIAVCGTVIFKCFASNSTVGTNLSQDSIPLGHICPN